MTAAKTATAPAAPKKAAAPANSNAKVKHEFKANDHVVYPTHGVGKITRIEEQEVAGAKLELFVITFDKDKMTLRVPTTKAKAVGMRTTSSHPRSTRSRGARASSGRCGAAGRRNTKPRSTPAISSRSPRWSAISIV